MTMIFMASRLGTPAAQEEPETFDYYIGPSGSDSNDGLSTSTPWAITALNTKTATYAGSRVGIMDGTYNVHSELIALDDNYDGAVFMIPAGSVGSPTVIASVNARMAVFSGKSGSTYGNTIGAPAIFGTGAGGYVEFHALAITGSNRWGIRAGIPYDTGRDRIPGIVVKDCEFYDFNGANLADNGGVNVNVLELNQCTGFLIQNNYFHDSQGFGPADADHWSAIETWQCINGVVEYNTSILAAGFDGKLGAANGNALRYNYLDCSHLTSGFNGCLRGWGSESTGSPSWGTAEDQIHNNVLIGTTALNLLDYFLLGEYTPHAVSVMNNTLIVTAGGAASFVFLARIEPNGFKFFNNILTSEASGDQSFININVNANGLMDYNSYYRSSGTSVWRTYSSHNLTNTAVDASPLSAFRTELGANSIGGANAEASSTSGVDPLFVASGSRAAYYALQSGSTLKAGGSNPGRSDGTSAGSLVDRGAWGGASPPARIGCDF